MHRAERSTATVRNAKCIGRRMAGSRAKVNDFLLGRDNGERQGKFRFGALAPLLAPFSVIGALFGAWLEPLRNEIVEASWSPQDLRS